MRMGFVSPRGLAVVRKHRWAFRTEILQLLRGFAKLGPEEPLLLPELPKRVWPKLAGAFVSLAPNVFLRTTCSRR